MAEVRILPHEALSIPLYGFLLSALRWLRAGGRSIFQFHCVDSRINLITSRYGSLSSYFQFHCMDSYVRKGRLREALDLDLSIPLYGFP